MGGTVETTARSRSTRNTAERERKMITNELLYCIRGLQLPYSELALNLPVSARLRLNCIFGVFVAWARLPPPPNHSVVSYGTERYSRCSLRCSARSAPAAFTRPKGRFEYMLPSADHRRHYSIAAVTRLSIKYSTVAESRSFNCPGAGRSL